MTRQKRIQVLSVAIACGLSVTLLLAQPPEGGGPFERFGFGPPGGFRPGGPMGGGPERELVDEFDQDENGWLDRDERASARESLADDGQRPERRRRRGGPPRRERPPAKPGPKVSPNDVNAFPNAELYNPTILRTLFIEFENEDWEKELEAFHNSDVEVPAKVTVDGNQYRNVGIHFRGMSSYGMVSAGYKRSLNLSFDFVDEDQRLYGYKTLNLLNCNGDPSLMSTVLYSQIARQYIAAPKANFVKVVINGESWGTFVNAQQFDKIFVKENFASSKGTRWKVNGSPRADGGLRYLGDDIEQYKQRYEMKSNDGKKAWNALIELCRTLEETPAEDLETALEPMLDIDETLRFLAIDVALVNSDGYWTRASDYSIFREKTGKFHLVPHDMNEAFQAGGRGGPPGFRPGDGPPGRPPGFFGQRPDRAESPDDRRQDRDDRRQDREGRRQDREGRGAEAGDREPRERGARDGEEGRQRRGRGFFGLGRPGGRRGGPGHGGTDLDPLVATDDPRMALRQRLLSIPKLRDQYLSYVREIAEKQLDWQSLGPLVAQHRALIETEVRLETRALSSVEDFLVATADEVPDDEEKQALSLRSFADKRREFLLNYTPPQE